MTPNDYQRLAMRTSCFDISDPTERKDMLRHAVFGLASEAGEVTGILQKEYQGHEVDEEHLVKELGDVCWMLAEACQACGVSLEEVMAENIAKLMKRYPDGFDADRSVNREEDDV